MPSAETILAGLRLAANDTTAVAVAVAWHLAVAGAAVALWVGWRPSRRLAAGLLSTPIASTAIVAFAHGNPFNGSLLGALAVALVIIARRFDRGPVCRSRNPLVVVGATMIGFGLFYPHFLDRAGAMYLVAAPTGLIPCPTLSLVIGFTLVAGNLQSKAWSGTLALVGLFYGFFGVFRLGVTLDIGLVVGAAVLMATVMRSGARATKAQRTEPLPAAAPRSSASPPLQGGKRSVATTGR